MAVHARSAARHASRFARTVAVVLGLATAPGFLFAEGPTDAAALPAGLEPLSIDAMRAASYPGGDFALERTLPEKPAYRQYVASFRSEGLKQYGLLAIPKTERPEGGYPAILFLHGYIPPAEYRTTERYVAYVDDLAESGYIVFKPDYRGHGSSEGRADGGFRERHYTVDALNALGAMKRMKEIDAARIGVWGHSLGGQVGLRVMVTSGDIRAGSLWAGVVPRYSDILAAGPRTPSGIATPGYILRAKALLKSALGDVAPTEGLLRAITPNLRLDLLAGPVQLHHSTLDHSVPYEYSVALARDLEAAGKSGGFFTYKGDDHNLAKDYAVAMKRTLEFFDRELKTRRTDG